VPLGGRPSHPGEGMTTETLLWHDNPSGRDLLGFGPIVESVVEALSDPELSPLTIGIHAPWGAGKTTVLGMVKEALLERHGDRYVVVRTSPWEYDDHADTKGELIGEVLTALQTGDAGVMDKVAALLKRIAWARVGKVVAKGLVTMQLDIDGLIDALTPAGEEAEKRTMRGFRVEFQGLLDELTVERMVVLVDDLDRCLPAAVMATFEAIKLFLSVPRMSFVIAADNDMVQDAIAASLGETRRSERFARRYVEKIVQRPVALPRLSTHEAEAYIALLLASHSHDEGAFERLVAHCHERRRAQQVPYVSGFGGPEGSGRRPAARAGATRGTGRSWTVRGRAWQPPRHKALPQRPVRAQADRQATGRRPRHPRHRQAVPVGEPVPGCF
jgi:hypothetical protein